MENNEFKNLWKTMEVRQYSEAELNDIAVKSAKKSMRKLYPGWKVKVALCAFAVGYMLWKIICSNDSPRFIAFYIFIILIIMASLILGYFSKWKMNKYRPDIPMKEWLKFRIDELNKSIRFQKKYRIHIHVSVVILIVGICAVYFYMLYGSLINYSFAFAVAASLLMLVIFKILWKDRYSEVRDYLQSMYEQLGE